MGEVVSEVLVGPRGPSLGSRSRTADTVELVQPGVKGVNMSHPECPECPTGTPPLI